MVTVIVITVIVSTLLTTNTGDSDDMMVVVVVVEAVVVKQYQVIYPTQRQRVRNNRRVGCKTNATRRCQRVGLAPVATDALAGRPRSHLVDARPD